MLVDDHLESITRARMNHTVEWLSDKAAQEQLDLLNLSSSERKRMEFSQVDAAAPRNFCVLVCKKNKDKFLS